MTKKLTHSLRPAAALRAWLESSALQDEARARIRLPLVVLFQDERRWSVGRAFVGTSLADAGAQSLALQLDDSGLGIALIDTLRHRCRGDASDDSARGCVMWVEGVWGPLIAGSPTSESRDAIRATPVFSVLKVGEAVDLQDGDDAVASLILEDQS